uniref:Uncharacterized protein n=1 Tax=Macaca fascicularis TaxID=9541 RepID=I7GLP9_MACFA|nr:unnamed protein product [Macaca fascicularis]
MEIKTIECPTFCVLHCCLKTYLFCGTWYNTL